MDWRVAVLAGAVGLLPVCAEAQARDAAWAQRQIIEAQCGTWARDQAGEEYAPQLREARQQLATMSGQRGSAAKAGAALATSNIGLLRLAQQSREKELSEACIVQREAQLAPTRTAPRQEEPAPGASAVAPAYKPPTRKLDSDKRGACDWGSYWNSSQQHCIKIGDE